MAAAALTLPLSFLPLTKQHGARRATYAMRPGSLVTQLPCAIINSGRRDVIVGVRINSDVSILSHVSQWIAARTLVGVDAVYGGSMTRTADGEERTVNFWHK